jgi:hypothetical protein
MRNLFARLSRIARVPSARRSPAPRPRFRPALEGLESRLVPTVTSHGGPVLANVGVESVFLGSDWSANPTLFQQTGSFDRYLQVLSNSSYMDMLSQAGYGVGRGQWLDGIIDQANLRRTLDDSTIQGDLQALINAGSVGSPDGNRLYFIYVQPGVEVTRGANSNSINDFLGYHWSFQGNDRAGNSTRIYYAVIPYADGVNAQVAGLNAFDSMTVVSSHELAEAVTDPQVNANVAWNDDSRNPEGEIGDIVNQQWVRWHGYAVQEEAGQQDQALVPHAVYMVGEFPGQGVWRFEDTTGWQQLTPVDASQVAIDNNGDVVGEFPGQGVWRFEDTIGWQQLTPSDASQVAIAGAGNVVGEFQGQGVWRFEDATGWQQLTPVDASSVSINASGAVAGSFAGQGVWVFGGFDSSGWQQLTTVDAAQVCITADSGVVGQFNG